MSDPEKNNVEQIEKLQRENDRLKQILADSDLPCIYCALSKEDWLKCQSGFPGCARADDMSTPDFPAGPYDNEIDSI